MCLEKCLASASVQKSVQVFRMSMCLGKCLDFTMRLGMCLDVQKLCVLRKVFRFHHVFRCLEFACAQESVQPSWSGLKCAQNVHVFTKCLAVVIVEEYISSKCVCNSGNILFAKYINRYTNLVFLQNLLFSSHFNWTLFLVHV